jgi:hypothetical protein
MAERFRIPWTTGKFEVSQPESTIAPPADLLKRWEDAWFDEEEHPDVLLIQAFQAGADQELEACVKLLELSDKNARDFLYSARRPKPPSLKEQALTALHAIATGANNAREQNLDFDTIRRALEQLDD